MSKITKIFAKLIPASGKYLADARHIETKGISVEEQLDTLLQQIEKLKKQVDDLIAGGGGVTPEPTTKVTVLRLRDGSYFKLRDGSLLKINTKK